MLYIKIMNRLVLDDYVLTKNESRRESLSMSHNRTDKHKWFQKNIDINDDYYETRNKVQWSKEDLPLLWYNRLLKNRLRRWTSNFHECRNERPYKWKITCRIWASNNDLFRLSFILQVWQTRFLQQGRELPGKTLFLQ